MKTKTKQSIRLNIIILWVFFSIALLAEEEEPMQGNIKDIQYYTMKIAGIISLVICCKTGKKWNDNGLLPTIED